MLYIGVRYARMKVAFGCSHKEEEKLTKRKRIDHVDAIQEGSSS